MPISIINRFDGGLDNDLRSHSTNTFSDVGGFDTLTFKHKLVPFVESESEALASGDITDKKITDVLREGNGYIAMMGRNGSGAPTVIDLILKNSGSDISANNSSVTTVSGASFYQPNSVIFYNGNYYYINTIGQLRKIVSGTWIASSVATFASSSYWSGMLVPRPLVHPADKLAYFGYQTSLVSVDDTGTPTTITLDFSTERTISSMTDYGNYVAFATTPNFSGGRSKMLIWDRNTSRTAFTDSIDWGEGSLLICENLGGTLVGVSISDAQYASSTSYTVSKQKKLTVRYLSGNQAVIVQEMVVDSTFNLRNFKTKQGTKLYFSGDNSTSLYVVEKRQDGSIVLSKDRFLNNGTAITTLNGITIVGDYLFSMFDTASTTGNIHRTKVTSTYTSSSYYTTNINPNMDIKDRTLQKKLLNVSVSTSPMPANGTIAVYYSVDSSSFVELMTVTTDSKITTPTIRDASGQPLLDGTEYQFKVVSTGGAELTSLRYEYEVSTY